MSRRGNWTWTSAAAKRFLKIAGGVANMNEAITTLADRFLHGISCPPTDLEALCQRLGILEIAPEDIPFSGELRPTKSGFTIVYGRHLSKSRRRFTIAHE